MSIWTSSQNANIFIILPFFATIRLEATCLFVLFAPSTDSWHSLPPPRMLPDIFSLPPTAESYPGSRFVNRDALFNSHSLSQTFAPAQTASSGIPFGLLRCGAFSFCLLPLFRRLQMSVLPLFSSWIVPQIRNRLISNVQNSPTALCSSLKIPFPAFPTDYLPSVFPLSQAG